jgi:hypothetical protein
MTQLAITARDNKNLFSNYYLDNQIKNNPEWKKDEHKAAFSEIKKLYDTEKDFIPTLNEKQLEQRFFALFTLFALLNFQLLTVLFQTINPEKGEALAQVKREHLLLLPIRCISFITPADRRATLVEQAKAPILSFWARRMAISSLNSLARACRLRLRKPMLCMTCSPILRSA